MGSSSNGSPAKPFKFLIYGKTGWIGGLLGKLCESQGIQYTYGSGRLESRQTLVADLDAIKPTHVFNAAGVTGRPNVDWCESHKVETIRTNVVGTLTLADVEELLKNYENVCTLRVRMPISSDLTNPRNFITKISRYDKVVDIPNSMTILDELLPISIEMAKRNLTGIYNFTNPGCVSHNEILEMYRDYIEPSFTWKNFNLEEQAKVIIAPRSNNELDAIKLKTEFPELLSIKESLIKYVFGPNRTTPVAA
ncbi:dTDP-4-dehydrorhamnose reductase [Cynara cardunculus var. scolymus]|uniref:dTDP-4-dehydrorhamnose reductase n=1 Tax=Cynara cardunculus var. scolymus TaxID=59895 RepID=A0A103XRB8_CYNCS|nr:dTDP-4-dehydrorhamnose reductase [Cynara cardunculus var. scolymus]